MLTMRFGILRRLATPAISLGGGMVTLFLFRRGIGFAPISLGIAVLAWGAAILFSRRFYEAEPDDTAAPDGRATRFIRWVSRSVVVGLYQNVLFFLLPVWFGSAEPLSVNIVFPALLAALALFACFDDIFAERVIAHPIRRTLTSALLLFSVSVPALSLLNAIPLRIGVGVCAAVAAGAAILSGGRPRGWKRRAAIGGAAALLCGGGFYFISPMLPPVPVQCVSEVAARGLQKRIPVGIAKRFPKGTPKVFAHFAVAAPKQFKQTIQFQWYVNGEPRGKPIPSSIVGGRKKGFRTWTYRSHPHPGSYRVDLETGDGQLIGRVRFRVQGDKGFRK